MSSGSLAPLDDRAPHTGAGDVRGAGDIQRDVNGVEGDGDPFRDLRVVAQGEDGRTGAADAGRQRASGMRGKLRPMPSRG